MNAEELLADFDFGPGDTRQALLCARMLLHYLADHVYVAELNSGDPLSNVTAFKLWLHELSEEARTIAAPKESSERKVTV